jgi:hypothetical protein
MPWLGGTAMRWMQIFISCTSRLNLPGSALISWERPIPTEVTPLRFIVERKRLLASRALPESECDRLYIDLPHRLFRETLMRIGTTLGLFLILPGVTAAQTEATPSTSHFEGWPFSSQWGADKQSFEATHTRIRLQLGVLTVAENGFGWRPAFTDSDGTFVPWAEISAWCTAPDTLRIRIGEAAVPISYENIKPEDLTTIVGAYFGKYAGGKEPSGPEIECTSTTLRLRAPREQARDEIIELLEAASSSER